MGKWNGIANRAHPDYKIYKCWNSMKQRCYNENNKAYKNYGARGITMYDEWKNNFLSFYEWAKDNGWKEGLELDRIDNNGNYEPSNCQFITQGENLSVGKLRKRTDNISGYVGVCWMNNNKWRSYIQINKKLIYLGCYLIIEEALQARIDAEIKYFGKQLTNL